MDCGSTKIWPHKKNLLYYGTKNKHKAYTEHSSTYTPHTCQSWSVDAIQHHSYEHGKNM